MPGFAEALHAAVPDVAANAGDHGHRQFARFHDRPLFNVQFEEGAHFLRIEQALLFADGVDIRTDALHGFAQRFAVAAPAQGKILRVEFAKQGGRTHVRFAEPGAFLAAQTDDLER